ncbi:hypothetical protein JXM67_12675 [candidate division WOR-3 bacterium]|nr:hypothetical protein [candidate division WOR-3 bacterium]
MAKVRSRFVRTLGKLGSSILGLLSNLEERNTFNPLIRWLKLGLLGLLVTVISACARRPYPVITCYKPVMTLPAVSDVTFSPNPTDGADSVNVRATAKVFNTALEGNRITAASASPAEGLEPTPLHAADGSFSDTLEILEGYLDVSEIPPGTTWVNLNVASLNEGTVINTYPLVITEDSTGEE